MIEKVELIEEYKALRDEIANYLKTLIQLQTLLVIGPGALLGVALSNKNPNPFLYLSPAFVIIPILIQIGNITGDIIKIGSYIRVFLETEIQGIKWETRLAQYEKGKKDSLFGLIGFEALIAYGYILVGVYLASPVSNGPIWSFLALILLILAFTTWALKRKHYFHKKRLEYFGRWNRIKSDAKSS